jgi:hypothetical protein
MTFILRALIRSYQKILSPYMGNQCRFTPTCSCYMDEAVTRHGAFKGGVLGIYRIVRCNPWCRWGEDPVPQAFAWKDIIRYKTPTSKNNN